MQRRPRRIEIGYERHFYVTSVIDGLLNGHEAERGFPDVRATVFVDRFVAGHLLGVSLAGKSNDQVDIERLRDLDEVWALCIRRPKPGWRIFGRFMAKDCFVGLQAFDRHDLGPASRYATLAAKTVDLWNEMFSGREPHRGSAIDDYLGGVLRNVDDPD